MPHIPLWTVLFGLLNIAWQMPTPAVPTWYRSRRYAHFDLPIEHAEALRLVTHPQLVASHSFWPLLAFRSRTRVWKKAAEGGTWKYKARPIAYAAHADSHIFAYYCEGLQRLYEARLLALGISDCVLAYRKLPSKSPPSRGRTNYDFAAEVFAEIASRSNVEAIALDIKGFFDTIPHRLLKHQWRNLLGTEELPRDHYAVFKAATKFSQVSVTAVRHQLNIGLRQFRRLRRIPVTSSDFRTKIREAGLVRANTDPLRPWGIPQGLPISGLLANLVMLDFDRELAAAVKAREGFYRRYSDDILLVAPAGAIGELEILLHNLLKPLHPLEIQASKTVRCKFIRDLDGVLHVDRPLQYLGFEFNGTSVFVRPQTLARFSKRMCRAVRRAARVARRQAAPGATIKIKRRDLYARFSHLGPHRETPTARKPRGSFYGYGRRAESAFDREGLTSLFKSQIKRQLRRQTKRLGRLIAEAERGKP